MFTLPSVNTLLKTPTMYHLKPFSFFVVPVLLIACGFAGLTKQAVGQTVRFETNVGNIEVQLHPNDAPIAVANFLSYVNAAAGSNYEGTFFHRSINGDPDSATNQWFFNTADNSGVPPLGLDFQNGGFTVFGTVVSGLDVVDAIQAVDTFNLDAADPGTFDNVPLINNGADFVAVNRIVVVPVLLGDVSEADCDQSAMVEFADIPTFIAILIDQAGSQ